MPEYSAIDLFSGAGGFSLGMEQAGFRVAAAVDSDPHAVAVYKENFDSLILAQDITKLPPEKFSGETRVNRVDVIFGGPPCQGFSTANHRNHGTDVARDARRNLYQNFLQYVHAFSPRVFIMENVQGIKSAAGGKFFRAILKDAESLGYQVYDEQLCAWHYGVPQKRIRRIIFGIRRDVPFARNGEWVVPTHGNLGDKIDPALKRPVTLWEAIADLPILKAGESTDKYDLARRKKMLARYPSYIKSVARPEKAKLLNGHTARMHSVRDLRDFTRLREGESSAIALRNGVEMEFPYCREMFKDRYKKQHRNRLSSTILAHLSKDGLMFIHPKQNRSLTPREAARIQSFPDSFVFSCPRTHQFRLIGNAVPPLMARAIGLSAIKLLRTADGTAKNGTQKPDAVMSLPQNRVAVGGG